MDLFVVPAIGFDLLYAFVMVRLDRKISFESTSQPARRRSGLQVRLPNFSWGHGSARYDPRSRANLWHCRRAPIARHGHPGQAHCSLAFGCARLQRGGEALRIRHQPLAGSYSAIAWRQEKRGKRNGTEQSGGRQQAAAHSGQRSVSSLQRTSLDSSFWRHVR